jgi:Fe2+ transport system protein FeoA
MNLADLAPGQSAILDHFDLPEEFAHKLMTMGFIPGAVVEAAQAAPGGDPRVFRVDGSEVALRRETARHLIMRGSA